MSTNELDINLFTFGKYKNKYLKEVLKDRSYCRWLLVQDWFLNYEYLFNEINNYDPLSFFISENIKESDNFISSYKFFNLVDIKDLNIKLTEIEKICYSFYLKTIDELKDKILKNNSENPYDIKCPTKWLQTFEKKTGLKRDDFKIFINSYDLPNITNIIEDIKKEGNIEYKGAKSFLIAKKNSENQEMFWEYILKEKYGDKISSQFKYEFEDKNCFFDFINISSNIIYECKLGLKDFNEEQYNKYLLTLNKYKIIYLIERDCIINTESKIIYTLSSSFQKYLFYQINIHLMQKPSKFDELIADYDIIEIENLNP
jgi:hypothetical protein